MNLNKIKQRLLKTVKYDEYWEEYYEVDTIIGKLHFRLLNCFKKIVNHFRSFIGKQRYSLSTIQRLEIKAKQFDQCVDKIKVNISSDITQVKSNNTILGSFCGEKVITLDYDIKEILRCLGVNIDKDGKILEITKY